MAYIPPNIKREYETTETSYAKLGDKYDIHPKQIQLLGNKEKWVKYSKHTPTTKEITVPREVTTSKGLSEDEIVTNIKEVLGDFYQPIDDILIMNYVDSYLNIVELKGDVARQGRVMVSEKTNGHYINPSVNLLQAERNNLVKIGKELGINTASRIRLGIHIAEHQSKDKNNFWDMFEKVNMDIDV